MPRRIVKEPAETAQETIVEDVNAPAGVYTIKELKAAHERLNASVDIIQAALKAAGKERYTFTEAAKIINTFKHKEV